jgi:hypothetical protein
MGRGVENGFCFIVHFFCLCKRKNQRKAHHERQPPFVFCPHAYPAKSNKWWFAPFVDIRPQNNSVVVNCISNGCEILN